MRDDDGLQCDDDRDHSGERARRHRNRGDGCFATAAINKAQDDEGDEAEPFDEARQFLSPAARAKAQPMQESEGDENADGDATDAA